MVRYWEMLKEEIDHHPDGDTSHTGQVPGKQSDMETWVHE